MKRLKFDEEKTALALQYSYGSVAKSIKYTLDKKSNSSDNIREVLLSFIEAIFNNNASKISAIMTLLIEGNYDIIETIKEIINILKKSLEDGINTALSIGGFIIIFSVLIEIIKNSNTFSKYMFAF